MRGATEAEHANITGARYELTVVADDYSLRVHDGDTPGGWPIGGGVGEPVFPGDTVEAEISYGLVPNAGTSTLYARADHTHGTPAAPPVPAAADAVEPETSFGLAPNVGDDTTRFARADHTHGTPSLDANALLPAGGLTGQVVTRPDDTGTVAIWADVGAYPIKMAMDGTPSATAIQLDRRPDTGMYFSPALVSYNGPRQAVGWAFKGRTGPLLADMGLWLMSAPWEPEDGDASSSNYVIWGPLVSGGGVWICRSGRDQSGRDAAGKKHHFLAFGYYIDGQPAAEVWVTFARDFPRDTANAAYNWTEESRHFIDLGAQRADTQAIVRGGTLAKPGLVFHRTFFKAGLANTGITELAANEFSTVGEGVELLKSQKNATTAVSPIVNNHPEDYGGLT